MSDNPNVLRISAKNLGALALPGFCPRCFWLKLKAQNRLPFQIFPGIFSSIDAYTKRVVHAWIDQNGGLLVRIRSRRTNDQRFRGLRELAF